VKSLVTAVVIVSVSVAIYFLAIHPRVQNDKKLAAAAAAAGKTTVTVVEPTQTSSAPELILPANVEGNQMTSIYSRVDGYIEKWYVDIGDHVQQGQVLADIEAPQIDADLRMAQAQLKLAEANLKLAQTDSARSQELFQNHVKQSDPRKEIRQPLESTGQTRNMMSSSISRMAILTGEKSILDPRPSKNGC
jgi:multidrug efflux pump subunit AcrA (membrane-fusion protein)